MKIHRKKVHIYNNRSIEKSKDDVDYSRSYAIPKHAGILLVLAVTVLTTSVYVRYWSVMMSRISWKFDYSVIIILFLFTITLMIYNVS